MQGVRHFARAKTRRDAEQVDPFTKKRLLDLVSPSQCVERNRFENLRNGLETNPAHAPQRRFLSGSPRHSEPRRADCHTWRGAADVRISSLPNAHKRKPGGDEATGLIRN